jgi:hypothetical protein
MTSDAACQLHRSVLQGERGVRQDRCRALLAERAADGCEASALAAALSSRARSRRNRAACTPGF